jgi:hypothetical protein
MAEKLWIFLYRNRLFRTFPRHFGGWRHEGCEDWGRVRAAFAGHLSLKFTQIAWCGEKRFEKCLT